MDIKLQTRKKQCHDLIRLEHFTLEKSSISSFLLKTYRASVKYIINKLSHL